MKKTTVPHISLQEEKAQVCISLIGMAGSGKTTVGRALAKALGWAHVDADAVIEAHYGTSLQSLTDCMTKDEFLDCEAAVISSLRLQRAVLSTGGSVVYRPEAMKYLQSMGPIVRIDVPLATIEERIARNPDRGIAFGPGQTLEDLVNEREALYRQWADHSIATEGLSLEESAAHIIKMLDLPL